MIEAYLIHILIMIGIYIILAVSLNVALGYTGLLNLGHVAFFAVGAYTSALLNIAGVPFFFSLIIAGLFASLFGFILTSATKRLRGDYLALTTLGFSFVVYAVLINWSSLTGGPLGLPGIPKPEIFGIAFSASWSYLILVAIITVLSVLIMYLLMRSPFGRLLEATRDDEVGLRVLGKNTFRLKYKAMMISAFFAGIAGSLLAHYLSYIDPTHFTILEVIFIFTIVIIGGIASISGSIIGTFIIFILLELLRFIPLPGHLLGPLRMVFYAVVLLLILIYRPRGIFGRVDLE
ncbi:MAG: branched-chain amino acid ABC transporter permease [archaeon]|nr:branched-chain amino acid ABC transporter permease [Nanoarchaeota archaeon]